VRRRNSNSVTNIINYDDVLSVKSTMELNNTTKIKPTSNKIKITNKVTNDYTSFASSSRESFGSFQQSTYRNFRYPSYLMKVSPPQMCSNFDSNNMLLLPKICNKYYVRRNSNSVTNIINCNDFLSVTSTGELNNTNSMKPTENKIKITNKATTDDTSFDSESRNGFVSFQQSTAYNFRYQSSLVKVSLPQVCSNIENMLKQQNNKMHDVKISSSIMIDNNKPCLDEVCIKSSLEDIKSTNLNDNTIKTNKLIGVNQDNNCLTLNTSDLKIEGVMKTKNGLNCIFNDCDEQEEFSKEEDVNEVKLIKICKKCHKGWNVDNFDWNKVSKINKIKLLEIIKQNSKTEKPIPSLENYTIINNSNQNLSINKTKCIDKTKNNISI